MSKQYLSAALGGLCLFLAGCGGSATAPSGMRQESGGRAAPADSGDMAKKMSPPASPNEANPNKAKQESYAPITENAFKAVMDAPLSTFSADVNTAAYSNVRRYLNQGQLPPRDAVFLAEMVNYFPYRYPNAKGDAPVSLTLDMAACPWKPDHKLVRIGLRAKTIEPTEMPRRNFVFLVDVSGSMQPENRLPLVQKSLEYLIDQLTPQDKVSIVTYASGSEVKLKPTGGDQKETIRSAVRSLKAGGGTHGEGGIKLAYQVARGSFIEGGANRVILCTDGDFNLGQTSESELQQLVEKERISRVFLTVLGYGIGNLKNQTLELLANHGNGHYAYIDSQEEARKVFVEQGGALVCVAKDVKLQVEFNPKKVGAYRLLGYENRLLAAEDFKNDAKDAGEMGSGHTVTALYEVVPVGVKIEIPGVDPLKYQTPPQPAGNSDEWLTVKMRYKAPEGDASKEMAAPLPAGAEAKPVNEDFAFAAAVAEFALVLRDSPYKGSANIADVLKRAEASSTHDPNGHRKEFVELVKKATAAQK
ncbi:MAG TPA: von Willebrand factor type A domain-containing protein [Gemmataceae bacterium]|nr:von Willebrand factor type A domain-containing protein [Gemmataceae bacterium]